MEGESRIAPAGSMLWLCTCAAEAPQTQRRHRRAALPRQRTQSAAAPPAPPERSAAADRKASQGLSCRGDVSADTVVHYAIVCTCRVDSKCELPHPHRYRADHGGLQGKGARRPQRLGQCAWLRVLQGGRPPCVGHRDEHKGGPQRQRRRLPPLVPAMCEVTCCENWVVQLCETSYPVPYRSRYQRPVPGFLTTAAVLQRQYIRASRS
jgi:hypothetical protein